MRPEFRTEFSCLLKLYDSNGKLINSERIIVPMADVKLHRLDIIHFEDIDLDVEEVVYDYSANKLTHVLETIAVYDDGAVDKNLYHRLVDKYG